VNVAVRTVETLPARSVEMTVTVNVPSPRPATLMLNGTVPAPADPACVAVTLPPKVAVNCTTSVVREPAGSATESEMLEAFAPLT
jgi:hypothetical protein